MFTHSASANGLLRSQNSKSKKTDTPYWEKFTYKLTAPSAKTTIAFMNGDPSNDIYNGLDQVMLTY